MVVSLQNECAFVQPQKSGYNVGLDVLKGVIVLILFVTYFYD